MSTQSVLYYMNLEQDPTYTFQSGGSATGFEFEKALNVVSGGIWKSSGTVNNVIRFTFSTVAGKLYYQDLKKVILVGTNIESSLPITKEVKFYTDATFTVQKGTTKTLSEQSQRSKYDIDNEEDTIYNLWNSTDLTASDTSAYMELIIDASISSVTPQVEQIFFMREVETFDLIRSGMQDLSNTEFNEQRNDFGQDFRIKRWEGYESSFNLVLAEGADIEEYTRNITRWGYHYFVNDLEDGYMGTFRIINATDILAGDNTQYQLNINFREFVK